MSDQIEEWLAESTPERASIRVCLNRRLYHELNEEAVQAIQDLEEHQKSRKEGTTLDEAVSDDQIRAKAQRVIDAERAVREAEDREFVFETLLWRKWRELVDQHPPSEAQKQADPRADHNPDTFWPAAVAASCISPGMNVEQAERLRAVLPRAKWGEIHALVERINIGGSGVPKFVSSIADRLTSALNSTTALLEESLSPSSADESPPPESPTG